MRTTALPAILAAIVTSLACASARADGPPLPGTPATPAAATATAGPRLWFEQKVFDFGKSISGSDVPHAFKFRNAGTRELVIRAVKPSCGCTAAAPSRDHLAPGESGEIAVTFKSGDRIGPQHVQVQVYSNDPLEKDLGDGGTVLVMNGEMVSLLQVVPASVYVATLLHGTPQTRTVTVVPLDVEAVSVKSIEGTQPWLSAVARPYSRSGKRGFALEVTLGPEAPIGRLDERLIVHTDHPRQEVLRIGVFGAIHGRITVFPERIMLFAAEAASNHDQVLYIQRTGGADEPLPIARVEAPPFLDAQVIEITPDKRSEVRLTWKPDAPRGPVAGVVRVFLRDPEQPLFEIPVLGEKPRAMKVTPIGLWLEAPGAGAEAILHTSGGEVIRAAVEGGPIEAVVEKALDGDRVFVKVAGNAPEGPISGKVVVTMSGVGEEKIEVQVRGEVKK